MSDAEVRRPALDGCAFCGTAARFCPERRVSSVLFGDLVGCTTLAATRDPEEVREVLTSRPAAPDRLSPT